MSVTSIFSDIVKYFLAKKDTKRERLADFLDEVAEEARRLSETWVRILLDFKAGAHEVTLYERKNVLDADYRPPEQTYIHSKLELFYTEIETALRGKSEEPRIWQFMEYLQRILAQRTIARDMIDKVLPRTKSNVLLSSSQPVVVTSDLETAVAAIQREAAALEVLATTFRASL